MNTSPTKDDFFFQTIELKGLKNVKSCKMFNYVILNHYRINETNHSVCPLYTNCKEEISFRWTSAKMTCEYAL